MKKKESLEIELELNEGCFKKNNIKLKKIN